MLNDYFTDKEAVRDEKLESEIEKQLGFVGSEKVLKLGSNSLAPQTVSSLTEPEVAAIDRWLKRHTPMRDRAFRNTRETMRTYQSMGLIPADVIIPRREVEDRFIALSPEEAEKLKERLYKLKELFPSCSHTAKQGARYDFTSINDKNLHLSAKTTKKGV
jgi:hypothetical protein